MNGTRIISAAILALGLAACASAPPVRYYSLDDAVPATPLPQGGTHVVAVHVDLPDEDDGPSLVLHGPGHQVWIRDDELWATPLRHAIPVVVARDLDTLRRSDQMVAAPAETAPADADFRIGLLVQQLDIVPGQDVTIDATWCVRSPSAASRCSHAVVKQAIAAGPDAAEADVDALRHALRTLAMRIAIDLPTI